MATLKIAFAPLALLALVACGRTLAPWSYDHNSAIVPGDWSPGSVWEFTTIPQRGKPQSMTYRVTDEPANTCISGEWKKLELISGKGSNPAYLVAGSFVTISASNTLCDAYWIFRGNIVGPNFRGNEPLEGVTGGAYNGWVDGKRVR